MSRLFAERLMALAATLLVAGCSAAAQQVTSAPPPGVEVTPVVFKPMPEWADFTGKLEAVQTVEVHPRVGGYIDTVRLPEGAHVHKGELLFQIDPRPFQAEVDRLSAELQRARAQAALAKADGERAQRLIAAQAIAQGEFDRLDSVSKAAAADVAAAQASLDAAKLNLSFTRVTAPIDGRVSKALITSGNLVTTESLLTTIVSDGPIYASFNADEQTFLKYAQAQRGQGGPVYMGLMTEDGFPRKGRLEFIDNAVDARSGTIEGRALFDNTDGALTPGLFARVRLISADSQPAALVPEEALGADLGKHYVLVLGGGNHVQYRTVTLGPALGQMHVIRAGLQPGDQVVTAGLTKVKPGDVVVPTRVQPPIVTAAVAQLTPGA